MTCFHEENINIEESHIFCCSITKKSIDSKINEKTVVLLGEGNVGKTTLVSNISYGSEDDGEGGARNLVLRHEHEKISGQTSSLLKEIIGIKDDEIINYTTGMGYGWEDIVKLSETMINIFDTPGNIKYIRTTIFSLLTLHIDHLFICVDLSFNYEEPSKIIKLYIDYAKLVSIPYTILIGKKDVNDGVYKKQCKTDTIEMSNITNEGIPEIIDVIKDISHRKHIVFCDKALHSIKFVVIETYEIPEIGSIVTGQLKIGIISVGQCVKIINNSFTTFAIVRSIKKKQASYDKIYSGESGALHLSYLTINPEINKYSMIVSCDDIIKKTKKFKIILHSDYDIAMISEKKYFIMTENNVINCMVIKIDKHDVYCKTEFDTDIYFEDNSPCVLKDEILNMFLATIHFI